MQSDDVSRLVLSLPGFRPGVSPSLDGSEPHTQLARLSRVAPERGFQNPDFRARGAHVPTLDL